MGSPQRQLWGEGAGSEPGPAAHAQTHLPGHCFSAGPPHVPQSPREVRHPGRHVTECWMSHRSAGTERTVQPHDGGSQTAHEAQLCENLPSGLRYRSLPREPTACKRPWTRQGQRPTAHSCCLGSQEVLGRLFRLSFLCSGRPRGVKIWSSTYRLEQGGAHLQRDPLHLHSEGHGHPREEVCPQFLISTLSMEVCKCYTSQKDKFL